MLVRTYEIYHAEKPWRMQTGTCRYIYTVTAYICSSYQNLYLEYRQFSMLPVALTCPVLYIRIKCAGSMERKLPRMELLRNDKSLFCEDSVPGSWLRNPCEMILQWGTYLILMESSRMAPRGVSSFLVARSMEKALASEQQLQPWYSKVLCMWGGYCRPLETESILLFAAQH